MSSRVRTMPKHHTFLCLSKQLSPRDSTRIGLGVRVVLVPLVRVDSDRPVLGIPSRTGSPLGLHSDWTGTGTSNLAVVG